MLLVAFIAMSCLGSFPESRWKPAPSMPTTGLAAHRGAAESHPENTIAALEEAVRLGAAQIEFDVRGTADKKLVVLHDATVNRTTDGKGRVEEMSLAEIRALDAGAWKDAAFTGESVPTLREALAALPRDRWLNVNIKGKPWVAVASAQLLAEEERLGQSFLAVDEKGARAAVQAVPEVAFCLLERKSNRESYIRASIRAGAQFIQLHKRRGTPSPEDIERLRDAGLRINHCCSDTVEKAQKLQLLGVDFPLVDSFK
ncbi:MAG: glycerophosphoryl diester phosphodiesterase [Myxococcota bacterium]